MRHSLPITPQFYVTSPQPCPYLKGKVERKLFTALQGENAKVLNNALSHQGFRRSQNVLYRPSCTECSACLSARIPVADFSPSKSQRRIIKRNITLKREGTTPWATEEQYALFRKYLDARHATGGMADMDIFEFAAMVEETPVRSRVVEYTEQTAHGQKLIAVCLTDILSDGLSMVYSFFDPDYSKRSLGTFLILDHIQIAKEAKLGHVYLGYWVPGSPKMNYKAKFKPLEIYKGRKWQLLEDPEALGSLNHPLGNDPISEQVAAIHLPPVAPGN
jgi:arginine-tRNA-protein transferase